MNNNKKELLKKIKVYSLLVIAGTLFIIQTNASRAET
jgi:hypothetical protein